MRDHVYRAETDKSPAAFAADFKEVLAKNGFIIGNEAAMDMKKTFTEHGAEVGEDFDLHMIHVCKPAKSAKSLNANPERAILMPKFVMVFSRDGKTQIRYHHYSEETIAETVDDPVYPGSLAQTYRKIIAMIEESLEK